jgi:hypothetical protein
VKVIGIAAATEQETASALRTRLDRALNHRHTCPPNWRVPAGMIYTARRTLTLSSFGVLPVSRIGEASGAPRHAGSLSV